MFRRAEVHDGARLLPLILTPASRIPRGCTTPTWAAASSKYANPDQFARPVHAQTRASWPTQLAEHVLPSVSPGEVLLGKVFQRLAGDEML